MATGTCFTTSCSARINYQGNKLYRRVLDFQVLSSWEKKNSKLFCTYIFPSHFSPTLDSLGSANSALNRPFDYRATQPRPLCIHAQEAVVYMDPHTHVHEEPQFFSSNEVFHRLKNKWVQTTESRPFQNRTSTETMGKNYSMLSGNDSYTSIRTASIIFIGKWHNKTHDMSHATWLDTWQMIWHMTRDVAHDTWHMTPCTCPLTWNMTWLGFHQSNFSI